MVSNALDRIYSSGVIAILRAPNAGRFAEVARALMAGGVVALEFTMTSEGALEALAEVAPQLPPEVALGAGTVLDGATADAAIDAGASYLVSPTICLDVIARGVERGIPTFPGAATPTEILTAWWAGASAVKVFPASTFGPEYLRHVHGPLPDIPLVPTGGIGIEDAGTYIKAGAVAVGVGSPLMQDAAKGGDLNALTERAKRLIKVIAEARSPA